VCGREREEEEKRGELKKDSFFAFYLSPFHVSYLCVLVERDRETERLYVKIFCLFCASVSLITIPPFPSSSSSSSSSFLLLFSVL
jgi:hypothetical protein